MPIFSPQADRATLILIRHGATTHNLENPPRLQGQGVDSALSDEGLDQSRRIAALLSQLPLAAVYCSPLNRARSTAEKIAEFNRGQPELKMVPELVEVNVGHWEGLSWAEVAAQDAARYELFRTSAATLGYPGGETIAEVATRGEAALRKIASAHIGNIVAVVAHSVVNRSMISQVLGIDLNQGHLIPQENCTLNVLTFNGKRWKVKVINSVAHLECEEVVPLQPRF